MNFKILTDKELSDNIKNKKYDNESLKELINRHSNLVIYMINSIMSDKDRIFNKNQILDEKDFFIYKTALKFNDKNKKDAKFSTLLGNEVKWACLNTYNRKKDKPNKQIEDIPDVSSEEDLINDVECKDNLLLISKLINKIEDKRAKRILELRYKIGLENKVMPWRLISKDIGLSIQGCINLHNKTIEKIQNDIYYE
jgi:hypothetical protein